VFPFSKARFVKKCWLVVVLNDSLAISQHIRTCVAVFADTAVFGDFGEVDFVFVC
jgi:hypothetical protein